MREGAYLIRNKLVRSSLCLGKKTWCTHCLPTQLNGNIIIEDKKLPQNETQLTNRSRHVIPAFITKQGHTRELAIANINDGMPKTIICRTDKAVAMRLVHFNGLLREVQHGELESHR